MDDLIERAPLLEKMFPCFEKKLVREAPAVNRWIPCSERLPDMPVEGLDAKYSDCCLVCDAHDWIGMAYCLTDGKKTWWEFADAQNKVKIDWTEVTHWMPLPEPPKVGGDAE